MAKNKLHLGLIPKETPCPFADKCVIKFEDNCRHLGRDHLVPYSCAVARYYDLSEESTGTGC